MAMAFLARFSSVLVFLFVVGTQANAQTIESFGGDTFVSGSSPVLSVDVPRDVFAAGFSVSLDSSVSGDTHAAGFDVHIKGKTGSDLYSAGSNILLSGEVAEDLTAAGFTVHVEKSAAVGGNARISGGTVTMDAPVAGSLAVSGGAVRLNAPVEGDVRMIAGNITFGSDAKILGKLEYSTRSEVEIPASVISADRVQFKQLTRPGIASEIQGTLKDAVPGFWPSFFSMISAFIVTLAFLLIIAAICLAFMPERTERLRKRLASNPGLSVIFGFVGLATLFGLVPVSAMTIVGIPLVPIVILAIITLWLVGYLLGVYWLAWRIAQAFRDLEDSNTTKLVVLAIGLVGAAILNFIPLLGPLVNFLIMLLGLGAVMISLTNKLLDLEVFTREPALADATPKSAKKQTGKE